MAAFLTLGNPAGLSPTAPFVRRDSSRWTCDADGPEDAKKARKRVEKKLKQVAKARARLMELVHPREGDFPTLSEIDAFLEANESELRRLADKKKETEGPEAVDVGPVVKVCMGKPCTKEGTEDARNTLEKEFAERATVEVCKCLGKCKEPGVAIQVQANGVKTRGSWHVEELTDKVSTLLRQETVCEDKVNPPASELSSVAQVPK